MDSERNAIAAEINRMKSMAQTETTSRQAAIDFETIKANNLEGNMSGITLKRVKVQLQIKSFHM